MPASYKARHWADPGVEGLEVVLPFGYASREE